MTKRPTSRRNLDIAIGRLSDDRDEALRLRRILANTIVAQLMPSGVVKGGSAMRIRFGYAATRFSADLDTARAADLDAFVEDLTKNLEEGWNGFTGRIVPKKPAKPRGVPQAYVMRPFDVKLDYNGKPWLTVELEVGHNELGDADEPDYSMSDEIAGLFASLGLPEPDPVPLMALSHQIAQKLHGASEPGSERAHDLVDLQVAVAQGEVDWGATRDICVRLFAYRKLQPWPPTVVANERWDEIYDHAREGLSVLPTVDEAVEWANGLIARIDGGVEGMPGTRDYSRIFPKDAEELERRLAASEATPLSECEPMEDALRKVEPR